VIEKIAKLLKLIDALAEYSAKLFSFLVLIIIGVETMEVVLRYVFKSPTDWSWELSTLLTGVSFMMGAAWVLKEKKHVRTDIIYGRLSRKWQAILDVIFFGVIFTPFLGVLAWKSIENVIYSWQINERTFSMWGPPIAPSKTIFAIGILLLILQGIAQVTRDVIFIVKGEEI